jgi:hypothetical protein
MAMIGGVLLQLLLDRIPRARSVDRHLVNRISGTALDLIIVAAIGTLSLEAIGGNAGALAVLADRWDRLERRGVPHLGAPYRAGAPVRAGARRLRPVDGDDRDRAVADADRRSIEPVGRNRGFRLQAAPVRAGGRRRALHGGIDPVDRAVRAGAGVRADVGAAGLLDRVRDVALRADAEQGQGDDECHAILCGGARRSPVRSVFQMSPISNRFLVLAQLGAIVVHVGALYLGFTQFILRVEPIPLHAWVWIVVVSLSVLVAVEFDKLIRRRRTGPAAPTSTMATPSIAHRVERSSPAPGAVDICTSR